MEEKKPTPPSPWKRADVNLRSIFLLEMLLKAKGELAVAEGRSAPVLEPVPLPGPVAQQRHREPVMSRRDGFLFRLGLYLGLRVPIASTERFEPPRTEIRVVGPNADKPPYDPDEVAEKRLELHSRRDKVLNTARTVDQLRSEPWAAEIIDNLAHYRGTFTDEHRVHYEQMCNDLVRMVSVLREAVGWTHPDNAEPELYAPKVWAASFQKDINAVAEEINSMVSQQVIYFKSMQDRGLSTPLGG